MSASVSYRERLFRYFPPPQYLSLPAVGLDISDEVIKVIELGPAHHRLTLRQYGEEKIPLGVVQGGKVKNGAALTQSLVRLREKYHFSNAVVSLPEEQAYVVNLNLPQMLRKELREAIELRLEEVVPFTAEEVEFDYEIVRFSTLEHASFECVVSVFPKDSLRDYEQALGRAGILPVAFEIEGQALARALTPKGDRSTTMIVDFGKWRAGIVIAEAGIVRFSATVPFGGMHLNKSIMDSFSVSEDEAERMKRDQKLVPAARSQEFTSLVCTSLSVLADEINKYKLYWQEHKGGTGEDRQKIDRVLLSGGSSNVNDISHCLSEVAQMPVMQGNPWLNIASFNEEVPRLPKDQSLRYATAIGLALRGRGQCGRVDTSPLVQLHD